MSNPLVEKLWSQLTLLPEDSHARTIRKQTRPERDGKVLEATSRVSGGRCGDWLGRYDPDTSSWRTSQVCLPSMEVKTLAQSLSAWPKAGMMRSGKVFALPTLAHPITEKGCSWLLTPTTSDSMRTGFDWPMFKKRKGKRGVGSLPEQLSWLGATGKLNHLFYAWMMGFPLTWGKLED